MNQVADKGTYLPSYIYYNNAFVITQTQTSLSLSVSYWFSKAEGVVQGMGEKQRGRGGETSLSEMFLSEDSKLSGSAVKFHERDSEAKIQRHFLPNH